jgi:gamma-glutamyl-gamma-aminobutyrate hydrolase PuuD
MKILISQQEFIHSRNNFPFDALERSFYVFLRGHELIPAPNINKVHYNDYDCLLLTGGPDSLSRHLTENLLYQHATQNDRAVLGICHGAFAINDLLGGKNGQVEGHRNTEHTVVLEGKEIMVNSYHSQCIRELADELYPLAHDEQGNCEAFKHKSKQQWGVVWHPERMSDPVLPDAVREFLSSAI